MDDCASKNELGMRVI